MSYGIAVSNVLNPLRRFEGYLVSTKIYPEMNILASNKLLVEHKKTNYLIWYIKQSTVFAWLCNWTKIFTAFKILHTMGYYTNCRVYTSII